MDAWRLGRVVWSLRHRLGWQQADLATRARTSQSAISRIERGHGDRVPMRALRAVLEQLDAEVGYEVRWRAGRWIGSSMSVTLASSGWQPSCSLAPAGR